MWVTVYKNRAYFLHFLGIYNSDAIHFPSLAFFSLSSPSTVLLIKCSPSSSFSPSYDFVSSTSSFMSGTGQHVWEEVYFLTIFFPASCIFFSGKTHGLGNESSDILSSELPVPSELLTEPAFCPRLTHTWWPKDPLLLPLPKLPFGKLPFGKLLLLPDRDEEEAGGDIVEAGRRWRRTLGLKLGWRLACLLKREEKENWLLTMCWGGGRRHLFIHATSHRCHGKSYRTRGSERE